MKILPIIGIVLLCACEKEITKPIPPQHTISFTIDSALNSNGKQKLQLDYYHSFLVLFVHSSCNTE